MWFVFYIYRYCNAIEFVGGNAVALGEFRGGLWPVDCLVASGELEEVD